MDFSYEDGVLVSLVIGVVKVIISTSILLSTKSQNVKKVGMFYDCFRGFYKSEPSNYFLFPLYMLVLAPIFSWLSVILALIGIVANLAVRPSLPEHVKELRFRLSAGDLSEVEVRNLLQNYDEIEIRSRARMKFEQDVPKAS